jgi:hypothetical protein
LLFLLCVNLSFGLVIAFAVPGVAYVQPGQPDMGVDDYEGHFNSTDVAQGWTGSVFTGIPLIGDIFAGFNFLWQNIRFVVDGFPMLLEYISNTFITDASGQTAFLIVANVLRAIFAILVFTFLVEFISGRIFHE